MDGDSFRAAVAGARATELDRLDSPGLVCALSGGDPDRRALLSAAAGSERAARETFRAWAADEPDPDARAAFEAVAEREDDHLSRVLAALDGGVAFDDGPGPMHAYLRGREGAVERVAGGMVGRALVTLRTHARLETAFAGCEAEVAALFADLRADTEDTAERGEALLDRLCDDDWERARSVAGYTIRLAYDDFADALRGVGGDPAAHG